jgi:hypothetical protein
LGGGRTIDKGCTANETNQGVDMAAEGELDREIIVHRKGYERFIGMMRWGAVICLIVGFIVILAIAK